MFQKSSSAKDDKFPSLAKTGSGIIREYSKFERLAVNIKGKNIVVYGILFLVGSYISNIALLEIIGVASIDPKTEEDIGILVSLILSSLAFVTILLLKIYSNFKEKKLARKWHQNTTEICILSDLHENKEFHNVKNNIVSYLFAFSKYIIAKDKDTKKYFAQDPYQNYQRCIIDKFKDLNGETLFKKVFTVVNAMGQVMWLTGRYIKLVAPPTMKDNKYSDTKEHRYFGFKDPTNEIKKAMKLHEKFYEFITKSAPISTSKEKDFFFEAREVINSLFSCIKFNIKKMRNSNYFAPKDIEILNFWVNNLNCIDEEAISQELINTSCLLDEINHLKDALKEPPVITNTVT